MYANGSNRFGDSTDDRHEFTGSIQIGGGELSIRLNQATQSLQVHSASVDMQLVALTAYTGSNDSVVAAIMQTTASLNTYTGSLSSSLHDGSKNVTFNKVVASANGTGNNFLVGDDAFIGDVNKTNTIAVSGLVDGGKGFIQFGSGSTNPSIGYNKNAGLPAIGTSQAVTGSLLVDAGKLYFFNGGASNGGWTQIV